MPPLVVMQLRPAGQSARGIAPATPQPSSTLSLCTSLPLHTPAQPCPSAPPPPPAVDQGGRVHEHPCDRLLRHRLRPAGAGRCCVAGLLVHSVVGLLVCTAPWVWLWRLQLGCRGAAAGSCGAAGRSARLAAGLCCQGSAGCTAGPPAAGPGAVWVGEPPTDGGGSSSSSSSAASCAQFRHAAAASTAAWAAPSPGD